MEQKRTGMKTKRMQIWNLLNFWDRGTLNFQVLPPGANIALYKMASRNLEAKCVFWYQESDEFMVIVKRIFHKQFGGQPPMKMSP